VFAETGFDATSTRAIVEEAAGRTRPRSNYYFGSKEGLLREVLDRVLVALFNEQRDALHELSDKPIRPGTGPGDHRRTRRRTAPRAARTRRRPPARPHPR